MVIHQYQQPITLQDFCLSKLTFWLINRYKRSIALPVCPTFTHHSTNKWWGRNNESTVCITNATTKTRGGVRDIHRSQFTWCANDPGHWYRPLDQFKLTIMYLISIVRSIARWWSSLMGWRTIDTVPVTAGACRNTQMQHAEVPLKKC